MRNLLILLMFIHGCETVKKTEPVVEKPASVPVFPATPPSVIKVYCSRTPYVEYRDGTVFQEIDIMQLRTASKRCAELYIKSPCLVKIVKMKNYDYYAICGHP